MTKDKPCGNFLEELFEPTKPVEVLKRAERLARSEKARNHRAQIKELNQRKAVKAPKKVR